MDLGARTWLFLRELETEMKNWIAGVEMEVTELIQDAGYEVSKFVPKYFLALKLCPFLCPCAIDNTRISRRVTIVTWYHNCDAVCHNCDILFVKMLELGSEIIPKN